MLDIGMTLKLLRFIFENISYFINNDYDIAIGQC